MKKSGDQGQDAGVDRSPAASKLTRDQLALIHVARRDCQMADESYRKILEEAAGASTAAALDQAGFTAVMARFKAVGFVHKPRSGRAAWHAPAARFGARRGMATDAQIALMTSLWVQWCGRPDATGLDSWIERSYGCSSVRFMTTQVAGMAIEGLKQMLDRKARAPHTTTGAVK